ncbi:MAG: alpha/beta fold hydrolase [Acidimicrobiales bacterium]
MDAGGPEAGAHAGASRPRALPIDIGGGPPVLLIHGQPGGGSDWWAVAEELRSDSRVIAPDRPGWGSHPRPATTLAANADALVRMLVARGISQDADGPIIVVGHSLGGGIAIELALCDPELVGALVLVGSVGVARALTGMDRLLAVPFVGDRVLRAGGLALRRTAQAASRLSHLSRTEGLVAMANRRPSVRAVMAEGSRQMDGRERRSFLIEQRALIDETPRIEARLASLRVPCIVIHGASDHVVAPEAAVELAAAIPGAELLLLEKTGHRLPFEKPQVVAGAVRRYRALTRALSG